MTDILYIGDYAYSSWSLRGWLLFEAFGLPVSTRMVAFSEETEVGLRMQASCAPARTVPTVRFGDGSVAWDSLALAEELASRHPQAGLWPEDPRLRALARSLAAEMHASFTALRSTCPMNLRKSYVDLPISEGLRADLDRIEALWQHALEVSGGPWLCGAYSAADAFFAPVAGRIAGFSLPVGAPAQAYVAQHLNDLAFRRWRAMGLVHGETLPWYAQPFETTDWPGPKPLAARVAAAGPAVNETCPYSGRPVSHFLEVEGRIWGVCNAFCRDKTVADPEAWPDFMALLRTT